MLKVEDIHVYIGDSYIIQGISLEVKKREIVALLGRNGAGKTTTFKSIIGYLPPKKGNIFFENVNITKNKVFQNVRLGIGYVPEDRRLFPDLTVRENFEVSFLPLHEGIEPWTIERIFSEIPIVEKLQNKKGGELSGGEQQIVAIARALCCNPKLLLLDEPCEGLAPVIVEELGEIILKLKQHIPILMSEQNAHFALKISDRGYVIDKGKIKFSGSANQLKENKEIQERYLAV